MNATVKTLLQYLIGFVVLSALDVGWIAINYGRYDKMVRLVSGNPITLNFWAVGATYALLMLGLFYFAVPRIDRKSVESILLGSLRWAGVLGVVVYGVYSFTNLSILKHYDPVIAILDAVWGGVLFTLTAMVVSLAGKAMKG